MQLRYNYDKAVFNGDRSGAIVQSTATTSKISTCDYTSVSSNMTRMSGRELTLSYHLDP
jgi:hypothetical protein